MTKIVAIKTELLTKMSPCHRHHRTLRKLFSYFLLTRKLNHKCLVKLGPFSSAKVRSMHDHVKPGVRDLIRTILFCIAGLMI